MSDLTFLLGGADRKRPRVRGFAEWPPHSFRKTLALLGGQICKSPEEYKAWSQNLGHEKVLTTFSSCGDVAGPQQAQIIRALGTSDQYAE